MNYKCNLELCYQSLVNDPFVSHELNMIPHINVGDKLHIGDSNFREAIESVSNTSIDWSQEQVTIMDIEHTFFPNQNLYSLRLALKVQKF